MLSEVALLDGAAAAVRLEQHGAGAGRAFVDHEDEFLGHHPPATVQA
jgi:hypothetical protein